MPTHYKPDYEQDCILEGAAINAKSIRADDQFEAGEKPFRYNPENGFYEEVDVDSVPRASEYRYYKIKPLEANFRMVLYSLDVQKVEGEFNDLKRSVQGWTLLGSNGLSRSINEETNESCSSLVYRCLEAGGFYSSLTCTVSSQTSCAVDPENLLRHVVSAKAKELKKYPRTANWVIEGVNETPLDVVSEAYSKNGINASIEDDFIPSIKPSWSTCIMQ